MNLRENRETVIECVLFHLNSLPIGFDCILISISNTQHRIKYVTCFFMRARYYFLLKDSLKEQKMSPVSKFLVIFGVFQIDLLALCR